MNFKKIIILIFGVVFSIAAFAAKPAFDIRHWILKNKTEVFFVHRAELPMLDIAMVFSAGSSMDGKTDGIAAFTSSMMNEGANHLSAEQIAKNFESVGAKFSSFSNRDMACFQLRTLTNAQYLDSAITNFSAIIQSPDFFEKQLMHVRHQILAQLQSQEQNPIDIATNSFFKLLYDGNPYAHNPLGNSDSINSITRDQLIDFYKKYYVGENADLILVGDISESKAKNIAKIIAGGLPAGTSAPILQPANSTENDLNKRIEYPASQHTIMIGQVGITRENPDYFPLIVGNIILGGSQTSLLYNDVREKNGFAYFASSGFDMLKYRGPFAVMLQTKKATASDALDLTKKILKDFLKNGPTDAQLVIAKQNIINNLSLAIASNNGILSVLINIAFYHRPLNYLDTFTENVNAVTTTSVRDAFQKNLQADKLVTVVVGDNDNNVSEANK